MCGCRRIGDPAKVTVNTENTDDIVISCIASGTQRPLFASPLTANSFPTRRSKNSQGVAIPRNSGALMCGVKGMCESVRSLLTQSGVFEGRVLTNF